MHAGETRKHEAWHGTAQRRSQSPIHSYMVPSDLHAREMDTGAGGGKGKVKRKKAKVRTLYLLLFTFTLTEPGRL